MKQLKLILIGLLVMNTAIAQTRIYDIQYTTDAGSGTYPSTYINQTVTTGGIVTATGFLDGRYFISSSQGGAWNGIYIYDKTHSPTIGDSILITGKVIEYNGYTEISNLTSFSIKSSGNPLPAATKISPADINNEAYEGVLVELNNCTVSSTYDSYGNWKVEDGNGSCDIRPGIFNLKNNNFPLFINYPFSKIIGVVGIHYSAITLHPRSINDLASASNAFTLHTDEKYTTSPTKFSLPINISLLNNSATISSYSISIQYNPTAFEYKGYSKEGTISESGTVTDASTSGNIVLNFSGNTPIDNIGKLINLKFAPIVSGNANLQLSSSTINGNPVDYISTGTLIYTSAICSIPIGDTLTIVQRPLLNIPSIVIPGQTLNITCFAPPATNGWAAELFYNDITVSLPISQSAYDTDLQRWTLTTTIPEVPLYELYSLRVNASDGITDDVTNAVKVIDQYKSNYYFVQITDTHLPTHIFYGDTGSETDESELEDLHEVIKDINLIRPEFVLLTGDLINEGELEDFECRRNHTRSIEMLKKLEVPVYLVPGNHDLGGWDATPPSQGTSHREWWRFFGWRQPNGAPSRAEYYTHDYSFDYGNIHFTGLEAYDNYDSYMYSVYGSTSFIPSQITWLQTDLAAAGSKKKVLFYHYDFKKELNLTSLGVDMALWGHIHKDEGDINIQPYNLATAAVCDGRRAFRVIKVNNGELQPQYTTSTHSNGDMLTITFNMANSGILDSVSATIRNNYSLTFGDGLVKFIMPTSNYGYTVTNGSLEQVYTSGDKTTCYVRVNIPSGTAITTSIKRNFAVGIEGIMNKNQIECIPNPFGTEMQIIFNTTQMANIDISIYSITGQLIKSLVSKGMPSGKHTVQWDGTSTNGNKMGDGVYLCRFKINNHTAYTKQIILAQ